MASDYRDNTADKVYSTEKLEEGGRIQRFQKVRIQFFWDTE